MTQNTQRNWLSRNWKWLIPAGCLSILLVIAGFIFLIVTFVFSMMKTSDAYKQALAEAQANPAVIEALGSPIEAGYFTTGSINVSGPSGSADIAIPISGPKGKATIYAVATKSEDKWSFSKLTVTVQGTEQRIDLLGVTPERQTPMPSE